MSLLHLLLLHNVIRSTQNPYTMTYKKNNRRRSTETKEIVKKNPLIFATDAGTSLDDPFVRQCIKQVQQDPEMEKIVSKYSETLKQLQLNEEKQVKAKLVALCPKVEMAISQLNATKEELEKIGFRLKADYHSRQYVVKSDCEDGYDLESMEIISLFNDRTLTKKDVTSGRNKYQEELDGYLADFPNNKENIEKYQQKYDELSKKKLALVLKKNRETLEGFEYQINKYKKYYDTECKLRERAEFYTNLTEPDKQKLIALFDQQESFETLCDKIHDLQAYANLIAGKGIVGKEDDYQYLISKRIFEAQQILTPTESNKITKFCENFSQKLFTASNEELDEMKKIDRQAVDRSPEKMIVYKTLCVQTKENYMNIKFEHDRSL